MDILKETDDSGDLNVDGNVTLIGILRKCGVKVRTRQVTGFCEHDNEPSAFIKAGYFLSSWVTVSLSRTTVLRGGIEFVTHVQVESL